MHRVLASAMLLAFPVFGGGFWLEFANPKAVSDLKAKDAAIIVRATGCGEPSRATITGKAVGVVNGQRQTLQVEMIKLAQPGLYAAKHSLPAKGNWVLVFTGDYEGHKTGGVVKVSGDGFNRQNVKVMSHEPTKAEIEEALGVD